MEEELALETITVYNYSAIYLMHIIIFKNKIHVNPCTINREIIIAVWIVPLLGGGGLGYHYQLTCVVNSVSLLPVGGYIFSNVYLLISLYHREFLRDWMVFTAF